MLVVTADVTRPEDVDRAIAETRNRFDRIDILFNNAAINIRKPPQELSLGEWTSVLDTNLTSAFLMSKAVYPALKRCGGGKIINTGSMTSIFGSGFAVAYASSKGGRPAHQEPGAGLGRRQHPGQCHPAGLVRY